MDALADREEWTDEQRSEVVAEAHRILADAAFRNSKRCVALFRHLLDRSLAGNEDGIKERTLGAEVFGRPSDYDTATDPIVRVTANEIRKRLAQWYQESDHRGSVRIRLTAGAYLLTFEFASPVPPANLESHSYGIQQQGAPATQPGRLSASAASRMEGVEVPRMALADAPGMRSSPLLKWWGAIAFLLVAAVGAAFTLRGLDVFQSKDYLVWKPLLGSDKPLILSIADSSPTESSSALLYPSTGSTSGSKAGAPATSVGQDLHTTTPIGYAVVAQNLTDWLATHHQKSDLRGASAVSLQELRQGPVVLIGGFNPWALSLLSRLRYTVHVDHASHAMWIQDARNASSKTWSIDGGGLSKNTDYAVISRFVNPDTGNWILSFGGLTEQGTEAAKDLLVDRAFEGLLPAETVRKGNFQMVVKTNIINGCAGPPQVLAVDTW